MNANSLVALLTPASNGKMVRLLQCVAVCCSVLQCVVAVFCNMLQYVAVCCYHILQCVAVCCRVFYARKFFGGAADACLKRENGAFVAVCCSMLQYVTIFCNVLLQYFAVLQCADSEWRYAHCNTAKYCNNTLQMK